MGLLVNTLAADDKYPVLNRENLMIRIEMQLSQKQKSFSHFFAVFLKSGLNLEHFEEKKNDRHRFLYFHIMDSQNMFRKMSKKSCFRGPIDKQHGKRAQTLLKSAPQDLYHIY